MADIEAAVGRPRLPIEISNVLMAEVRRRRLLLGLFLVFIAASIAVLGWLLVFGRSEREVLQHEVADGLRPIESRYETVDTHLRELEALIGENTRKMQERHQEVELQTTMVQKQLSSLSAMGTSEKKEVADLQARVGLLEVKNRDLAELIRKQTSVADELQAIRQQVRELKSSYNEEQKVVHNLRQTMEKLAAQETDAVKLGLLVVRNRTSAAQNLLVNGVEWRLAPSAEKEIVVAAGTVATRFGGVEKDWELNVKNGYRLDLEINPGRVKSATGEGIRSTLDPLRH